MRLKTAVDLIEEITYKPGWKLYTRPTPDEKALVLTVYYTCQNSDSEFAPRYDRGAINELDFDFELTDISTTQDLLRKVLNCLIECERHEAEEFFKVGPWYDAPFHPHTSAGKLLLDLTADVAVPTAH